MPITFPVSPLIRWGVYLSSAGLAYLDSHGYLSLFDEVDEQDPIEWRRVQVVFNRLTPTGTTEDTAICTFDLVNFTAGEVDPTWTGGDYTAVDALFLAWWQGIDGSLTANVVLKEIRYYRAQFGQDFESGPPEHIYTIGTAGVVAATYATPYQVALSVTEKTALPRSWGRFYLPGVPDAAVDNYGRWLAAYLDTYADYTEVLYNELNDAQFCPVVPSKPAEILLPVLQLQIDDIPDVIRKRRPRTTLLRDIRTLA